MGINFPNSPADNTMYPVTPVQPLDKIAYVAKSSAWCDVKGRADLYNRFCNGSFQVSQLNGFTDGTNVNGLLIADEWQSAYTSDVGSFRVQLIEALTPGGGNRRIRYTINTPDTALSAGEWLTLSTGFEGVYMADLLWGTPNAKQIIIRFGFKGPAGTYGFAIRNYTGGAVTHCYVTSWTISAAEANTDTVQTIIIPGPTIGVWETGTVRFAYVTFTLFNGNVSVTNHVWRTGNFVSPNTITNNVAVAGTIIEFFDMACYADPNFTGIPPEFEVPDLTLEYQRCQRYLARCYGLRGIVGSATVVSRAGQSLPTPMRVVPALSLKGANRIYDGAITNPITSIGANYSSRNFVCCDLNVAAGGLTAARPGKMYYLAEMIFIYANAWY